MNRLSTLSLQPASDTLDAMLRRAGLERVIPTGGEGSHADFGFPLRHTSY